MSRIAGSAIVLACLMSHADHALAQAKAAQEAAASLERDALADEVVAGAPHAFKVEPSGIFAVARRHKDAVRHSKAVETALLSEHERLKGIEHPVHRLVGGSARFARPIGMRWNADLPEGVRPMRELPMAI